jgi:multicomponent Na+:H+ antiporter subunit C
MAFPGHAGRCWTLLGWRLVARIIDVALARSHRRGGPAMTIMLAATAAVLFGIGTYLLLQRKLSRIIIGLGLLTHGGNVLLITAGRRGNPPIVGVGEPLDFADPLPEALALTAIVITFGVTALLFALAFRSWLLTRDDEVQDDVGDRTVGRSDAVQDEVADQQTVIEREEAP